jgi:cell division protein FtsI/penicillin-binding protein 2
MKGYIFSALLIAGTSFYASGALAQTRHAAGTSAAKPASRKTVVKKKRILRSPVVDPTIGDNVDGDDLTIRRAAVEALGNQAGSIVVADPNTGRILTIVNQKLALKSGFTPCSTIKLVTSLAALSEHVVEPNDLLHLGRYMQYNMTTALAISNNQYFAALGKRLGFERVVRYAQMMGFGEKAGLDIEGEQPGSIVDHEPKFGGVGMMTSFGEGFEVTPLELAALLSAIANGGTLYYLQYPRNPSEIEQFAPRVKRVLDIAPNGINDIKVGMRGAVDYGTARRANYDPNEPIFGKTGTCTDFRAGSHMGWFGSFNETGTHSLVVVVMLTSPVKSVSGAVASGVAGAFYRNLAQQRYFASNDMRKSDLPEILSCCTRAADK